VRIPADHTKTVTWTMVGMQVLFILLMRGFADLGLIPISHTLTTDKFYPIIWKLE
jgi:hypothetical protein